MSEITDSYIKEIEEIDRALTFTEGRLLDDFRALDDRPECRESIGALYGAVSQAKDYILDARAICKGLQGVKS